MSENTLGTIVVIGFLAIVAIAMVVNLAPVIARAFTLPGF